MKNEQSDEGGGEFVHGIGLTGKADEIRIEAINKNIILAGGNLMGRGGS